MSLDYPDYVELKKRNRWLAFLWSIGDIGYYFGLLGAFLGPACMLIVTASLGRRLIGALILFVVFTLIFFGSASLKAYARKRGATYHVHW